MDNSLFDFLGGNEDPEEEPQAEPNEERSLALIPQENANEWAALVDRLAAELNEKDHVPEKVIMATEMLLAGFPTYKVAKKLNVRPDTVRRWLTQYPTMAAIVTDGKKLMTKWRMSRLEQQFLTAVERSEEILSIGLDGTVIDENGDYVKVNSKTLTVLAAQSRYIIGLFAGQKIDIDIKLEYGESVLKAKQDALEYIAEQLAAQRDGDEPMEAVFTVIDPKIDNRGPFLDEAGNPPFGELGKLDCTEDGIVCHICGKRLKNLARHLQTQHDCSVEDYENLYLLEDGAVRKAENY